MKVRIITEYEKKYILWTLFKICFPVWNNGEIFFSKFQGRGSKDDEDLFQPIEEMAHELNHCRLLIISSPIWNFSFPYVLKQYIDIALQPGVNFHEEPEEQPVTGSKTLVVVSSSGGHYGVVSHD